MEITLMASQTCIECNAQSVRYYMCKGVVNNDGIRSEGGKSKYLAFSDDKSIAYQSDKNGNAEKYMGHTLQYKYISTKEGKLVYQGFSRNLYGGGIFYLPHYLIFTKDLRKLNEVSDISGIKMTHIYEFGTPEDEIDVPDIFY